MKKNKNDKNLFLAIYNILLKNSLLQKIKKIMYYIDRIMIIFIKKPIKNNSNKKKVLIIYNLAFGDSIIFFHSLKEIRKIYPKSKYIVEIICQKGLQKIFVDLNVFDNIKEVDFMSSAVNLKKRFQLLKLLRKEKYDIVLDPVGANNYTTNLLMTRNILSETKIGCIFSNEKTNVSTKILNKTYTEIKYLKTTNLIESYFEFFYDKYNITLQKIPSKKTTIKDDYYIVFPCASNELKMWPHSRYAEIIKKINSKTKLKLLLVGTDADKEVYSKIKEEIGNIEYIDMVGKTNILEFIYLIQHAKFVITNDTSTYHISLLSNVPTTIIAGGYTYDKYVKYDYKGCNKYKSPYIVVNKMNCFNCYNKCKYINNNDKTWPCLDKIIIENAWKVIEKMIDDNEVKNK